MNRKYLEDYFYAWKVNFKASQQKVDKSILGGLVIKIDSQVIDISLKGQLRQISSSLDTTLVF